MESRLDWTTDNKARGLEAAYVAYLQKETAAWKSVIDEAKITLE